MKKINLTIEGQVPSKKNSMRIVKFGKRRSIQAGKKYVEWEKGAVVQIMRECFPVRIPDEMFSFDPGGFPVNKISEEPLFKEDVGVNAKFTFYHKDKRKRDMSNMYQGPEDALQKAGIIENDFQIASHDGSRAYLDRENPRVEIELTEVE